MYKNPSRCGWYSQSSKILNFNLNFKRKILVKNGMIKQFDNTIMKVFQVIHHKVNIRYGISRGKQCSCMSLMLVCWALLKSANILHSFDLQAAQYKKVTFLKKFPIITDMLGLKTYHSSCLSKYLQEMQNFSIIEQERKLLGYILCLLLQLREIVSRQALELC